MRGLRGPQRADAMAGPQAATLTTLALGPTTRQKRPRTQSQALAAQAGDGVGRDGRRGGGGEGGHGGIVGVFGFAALSMSQLIGYGIMALTILEADSSLTML